MSTVIAGTLAELEYRHDQAGVRFVVEYWRGGPEGDDEKVRRDFATVREACRFMATIAANKARAWSRER